MTMKQGDGNPDYVATKATVLAGTVSTLAGTGIDGHLDDPTNGLAAMFNHPQSVAAVGDSLYVADTISHYIRKVSIATSAVSTIAGTGSSTGYDFNPIAVGTTASFSSPAQIATDGTYLYVADNGNSSVRRITLSGSYPVETYTATFSQPTGIAVSGGYLYVSDYADGVIYKLDKTSLSATADAFYPTGMSALIRFLATDGTFLYLATGDNNNVLRISLQDASSETLFTGSGHVDGYGSGSTGTPAAATDYPWGIAVDSNYLYFSEGVPMGGADTIRRMHLGTRYVDTLAGIYGTSGAQDGPGTTATFKNPAGLCIANGAVYVADKWNHKIRRIQ